MTTKFIGVREFRQNLSELYKNAGKKNIRYIVLNKNKPVFEVKTLNHKEAVLESLLASVREAEADFKAGRVYSWEQVKKELGL
ncbi:MAG: hypothetical protein Q7S19_02005 [bacterium]|nr:hypothetical protein [bacterium]